MVEKMLGIKEKSGNVKKKCHYPALIESPGRWTGNKFIFKGGLMETSGTLTISFTLASVSYRRASRRPRWCAWCGLTGARPTLTNAGGTRPWRASRRMPYSTSPSVSTPSLYTGQVGLCYLRYTNWRPARAPLVLWLFYSNLHPRYPHSREICVTHQCSPRWINCWL